jgi:sugar phosphate isomerase/epimerase
MVAVKDFIWSKKSGQWKTEPCPLGEGMVDWPKFFGMLARARFTGPISLHVEYNPADQVSAMQRDLEFVRKHIGAAYANVT